MKSRPRIGLALGSGASRGLAHIGVLQVLEEHGLYPDFISGSSIGAIVGALYASGVEPRMMEGIAKNLDIRGYYDFKVPRRGFIQGKRLEELMRLLTGDRSFEELKIPLSIAAVDLKRCETIILNQGKVYKAIRASISIPGIFVPVYDGDRILVDGGLLERVPTGIVKQMGADIVIGVDVGFRGEHRNPTSILEIILQSMDVMGLEILKNRVQGDEIMIYPSLNNINPMLFDRVDECITEGRRAAKEAIKEILMKIEKYYDTED
jgi:NTE family protein